MNTIKLYGTAPQNHLEWRSYIKEQCEKLALKDRVINERNARSLKQWQEKRNYLTIVNANNKSV